MKYRESDLNICFDPSWRIKRFDNSKYFKLLSGLGLKGVDFIAIDVHEQLYLIEVKNYKKRIESPVAPDISDLYGDFPLLQNHFVAKIKDSNQLLEVIFKYLNRKWWYKWMFKMRDLIPADVANSFEWAFWYDSYRISNQDPQKVSCILLLETEDSYPDLGKQHIKDLPTILLKHFDLILGERTGSLEVLDLAHWHKRYFRSN